MWLSPEVATFLALASLTTFFRSLLPCKLTNFLGIILLLMNKNFARPGLAIFQKVVSACNLRKVQQLQKVLKITKNKKTTTV